MGFRLRLDHYEYVPMNFGLLIVVITLHMVNCKLPCLHSLPRNAYVGTTLVGNGVIFLHG
jgi:hypothetical protein